MLASEAEVALLPSFIWFVTSEDFDEENNLNLEITTGRLRHRWVPTTVSGAMRYILNSEDAAGLRAANERYHLVQVFADVKVVTDKYPQAIPEGFSTAGMVIQTPVKISGIPLTKRAVGETGYKLKKEVQIKEKQLSGLEMNIMSDEEVRKLSVMEVIQFDVFNEEVIGSQTSREPIIGGLHDLRMGTIDKEVRCQTCNLGHEEKDPNPTNSCSGHFGRIELGIPIPKYMYLRHTSGMASRTQPIMNILNRVCHKCSRITLEDEHLEALRPRVMTQFELGGRNPRAYAKIRNLVAANKKSEEPYKIRDHKKHGNCPHCGTKSSDMNFLYRNVEFRVENPELPYYRDELNGATSLDFFSIRNIFAEIPDEDCWFLGVNPETSRPENMFMEAMPVAPVNVRPTRTREDGEIDLDDLTKLYQDVVYWSDAYRRLQNQALTRRRRGLRELFNAVSRVSDNRTQFMGSGGSATRLGYEGSVTRESFKGIMNRFGANVGSGKEGKFRKNMQSKYVENTSRSVISPDPNLAIDQIGIPMFVCTEITFPEPVTRENIEELRGYILNVHEDKYPMATRYSYGTVEDLKGIPTNHRGTRELEYYENIANKIEVGMIVERHLIEGDIGLFGRAPHLHRQSEMAFRIVPIKEKGFTMNPTVCIPFNADYDGDQMNVHFVQSVEAREEAKRRMHLTKNIIHARFGALTVATDQDQTSGLYILTHTNMRRANEWNPSTGVGFTDFGIPYVDKKKLIHIYSTVYSEIRSGPDKGEKRTIETLPSPDYGEYYTGRVIFSHLFDVIDANYVSATFTGNTPKTDQNGDIIDGKERILIENGVLLEGTIEKDAFGEGGSSIAPSFIYHEGYEKGTEKLCEYIELVTRLGLSIHINLGYSIGIADVGVSTSLTENHITPLYDKYAKEMMRVERAFRKNKLYEYALDNDPKNRKFADSDPIGYLDQRMNDLSGEYEKELLPEIQNEQGSSNAMQVSVRSKARGKPENVRQMCASYGMASVSGRRQTYGLNADYMGMGPRVLPHFPLLEDGEHLPLSHPAHAGFIKSSYSSGMKPYEYWFTSSAGRRSMVESGMGNISTSGYMERKMTRALESIVVNERHQAINLRTGRVISPRVGDDGLAPNHIRGSKPEVNRRGYTLTLQPLKFQSYCKHGYHLEELVPSGQCPQCAKGSDVDFFRESFVVNRGIPVSDPTIDEMVKILQKRELFKPDLRKMVQKMKDFHEDSLCKPGEAIGSTAAQCLGEPATQAALRTFHFAGKLTATGDIERLVQIVELSGGENKAPRTLLYLRDGLGVDVAEKVKSLITQVKGNQIFKMIGYDVKRNEILIHLDREKFRLYGLRTEVVFSQIVDVLSRGEVKKLFSVNPEQFESIQRMGIDFDTPIPIRINSRDSDALLFAKNMLMNSHYNGINGVTSINIKHDGGKNRHYLEVFSSESGFLEQCFTLNDFLDLDLLETNNHNWVYKTYGLECALQNVYDEIDYQMNLAPKGIGDYDNRYIRTLVDAMGEYGELRGLGPSGIGVTSNPSMLAALSLENIQPTLIQGTSMGNYDPLMGVTESLVVGKNPIIGDYSLE